MTPEIVVGIAGIALGVGIAGWMLAIGHKVVALAGVVMILQGASLLTVGLMAPGGARTAVVALWSLGSLAVVAALFRMKSTSGARGSSGR